MCGFMSTNCLQHTSTYGEFISVALESAELTDVVWRSLSPGQSWEDIPEALLIDCCQLVKVVPLPAVC